jgi:hypothetical protein
MPTHLILRYTLTTIKGISIILITSAMGLEAWNLYAQMHNITIPVALDPVFALERIAVSAHGIEGIVAAGFASSKAKMPISYGFYTFFVGTIGLVELFTEE